MRKFIIYIFVIFFCASCDKSKSDFTIKARLVHTYDSTFADNTKKTILQIDLSLINNSKNVLSFWTMSCSWTDNWLINTDNYSFMSRGCDRNFPMKVKIEPNDSIVYHSMITTQDTKFKNFDTTRFGLIFIDTVKCKSENDFLNILGDRSNHDNIIWSNPLTFAQDNSQKFFVNNIKWTKENKNYRFPLLLVSTPPDTTYVFLYKTLIKDYQKSDSCIKISIKYGGGCNNAYLQIMADTNNASKGAAIKLYFAFQDYDDCKALLRYDFYIDLTFLRSKYFSNPITFDFINNRNPIIFKNK
jgi:hypothetical protein